ncbi:MAG: hypothetical protein PHQ27_08180 [Victivallales bacterium]|nr:hypothetical protein [Victivallales bacterium]
MTEVNIMDCVRGGRLPAALEDKTRWLGWAVTATAVLPVVTSILLAAVRRDHFAGNVAGWVEWAATGFHLTGAYRDHLRAVGEMMLDLREQPEVYDRLYRLAHDKLLAISRLPRRDVARFLAAYPVAKMDRDAVRAAVNLVLGQTETTPSRPAGRPGLEDAIDSLIAGNAASLAAMRATAPTRSREMIRIGFGLVGTAAEYLMSAAAPDTATIAAVSAQLETTARQLREFNRRLTAISS